ncbi:TPA: hypothetical protein R4S16_004640 [Citrobacter amalonaticus]|nr:hypothetical protein [Citrobacter amalonaticus]
MKLTLEILPLHETPQFRDLLSQGVYYVHGSNSYSLEGLSKFRAILSMEEMDGTGWFSKYGIKSGERGYTVDSLYHNQPVSQGVSLNYIQNFQDSIQYTSYGKTQESYPVLYGFGQQVSINPSFLEHPVSKGGINIDMLRAIYVPASHISHARQQLSHLGWVSDIIRPFLI